MVPRGAQAWWCDVRFGHAGLSPRVAKVRVASRAWWRQAMRCCCQACLKMPMARLRRMAMTWGTAGAGLGGVFAVGDVAEVVQGFDAPVGASPSGERGGCGLGDGQAGDGVDGESTPLLPAGQGKGFRRVSRMAWAACGKASPVARVAALSVRCSSRPWPQLCWQALTCACRPGWFSSRPGRNARSSW